MSKVSVLILRAAGINCDEETAHAFRLAGAERVDPVHINAFIQGRRRLSEYDVLVLSGGFSYGDDLSGGKVLANEMQCKLMEDVESFIGEGKLILGICNGFQVLVKMGLLPQTEPGARRQEATVFYNDSGKFECRWVYLRRNPGSPCVFTRDMPETIYIPVANGEGKVMLASEDVRARLGPAGHVALQYVNPPWVDEGAAASEVTGAAAGGTAGEGTAETAYPWSPNGSVDAIAGICDATGRIFGLMPHPERYTHPTHHPRWTREGCREPDGLHIFRNAVNYVRGVL
ncbi:MAG: phosphoribosylformylglycinamidine synthase subunit PurQ [Gemmatimonadetes bacterium]|nr:phosphoribosylformylglycinamidine synthase subunit PurQ [Gemmatimonadota bacterium]MYB62997.1 phosphoribosylformylglycinamidine synthase subunit PurQ [Gemmatimonadota bacterium]